MSSSSLVLLPELTVTETEKPSTWTSVDVNQSESRVPQDCVILGLNATIPWNNPNNLISLEEELLFDRIMATVIIPILFIIGFPANCINMVVFFKQGLKERINVCLFSLAVVDLITVTVIFAFHADKLRSFTIEERIGTVYRYVVNNNVIGLYGFIYGPMFLSVIVSIERCICVWFPLRAQRCIPTKAIALIIVFGVSVVVSARFAVTAIYQVTCFYEMRTQRVSWQPYFNDYYFRNKAMVNALNSGFYGFFLTVGCPIIVLVTTIVTAVRLKSILRWRSQTSSSLSNREIGVTKMLIALSIEFFVLSIPVIVLRVLPVFEPRLGAGGEFANSFNLLLGLTQISSNMSSTVNFFVYYCTGSRFRETLHGLIRWKTPLTNMRNGKPGSTATVTSSLTVVDQAVDPGN